MTILTVGLRRAAFETKGYFRSLDAVFFTFLFPTLMLAIFAVAFSSAGPVGARPDGTGGISVAASYLPGLVAAAIVLSGVQNLAIDIAAEKSDGRLRRLGATPLSPASYFLGKAGQVLVTSALQLALLLLVARFAFGVTLPDDPALWARFAWLFLLGIAASTLLGIALSALPRSGKSATAVVVPIVLVLQFISGVYLSFSMLPAWLQNVAGFFPLRWLAQGMRSVFLPARFEGAEPSGSWDLGLVAFALGIWLVAGLVVTLLTFRWVRRS